MYSSTAIRHFSIVTSTMDIARELLKTGDTQWRCVLAQHQTAGRGQRGRHWYDTSGQCLCATFLVEGSLADSDNAVALSLGTGVAVVNALKCMLTTPLDIRLKWPNDLIIRNRKLGGILIERSMAEDIGSPLVGVGINIQNREFPESIAAEATSLLLEGIDASNLPNTEDLALAIINQLDELNTTFNRFGMAGILELWNAMDGTTGRRYFILHEGKEEQGIALGVTSEGALKLQCLNGEIITTTNASSLRPAPILGE